MSEIHIHKTRMLYNKKGKMIGRKCECGAIFTPNGKPSQPHKLDKRGKYSPNKSHGKRIGFDE